MITPSDTTTNNSTTQPIGERLATAMRSSRRQAGRLAHAMEDRADLAVRRDPWRAVGFAFAAGVAAAATVSIALGGLAAARRRR